MTLPVPPTVTVTHDPARNALVRRLLAGALPCPMSDNANPTPTAPAEARHEQPAQKTG
ncbi:hypothetical protein [Deinococcus sp. Arct2-2]|uniref:hypothetical protein n=1 Tax=Deinococcus sp. Arct2-2 TaxID=2568653 RepID=UPI001454D6E6|nr:hypothetical protein [Deinococcus sp. Arct2-2]